MVRDHKVVGSNPVASTINPKGTFVPFGFISWLGATGFEGRTYALFTVSASVMKLQTPRAPQTFFICLLISYGKTVGVHCFEYAVFVAPHKAQIPSLVVVETMAFLISIVCDDAVWDLKSWDVVAVFPFKKFSL